jgi:hypothetical protein
MSHQRSIPGCRSDRWRKPTVASHVPFHHGLAAREARIGVLRQAATSDDKGLEFRSI